MFFFCCADPFCWQAHEKKRHSVPMRIFFCVSLFCLIVNMLSHHMYVWSCITVIRIPKVRSDGSDTSNVSKYTIGERNRICQHPFVARKHRDGTGRDPATMDQQTAKKRTTGWRVKKKETTTISKREYTLFFPSRRIFFFCCCCCCRKTIMNVQSIIKNK